MQFILHVAVSSPLFPSATVGDGRGGEGSVCCSLPLSSSSSSSSSVSHSVTDQLSPSSEVVDEHRHAVSAHQVVRVSGERFVLPGFGITCRKRGVNKQEVNIFALQNHVAPPPTPTPPPPGCISVALSLCSNNSADEGRPHSDDVVA